MCSELVGAVRQAARFTGKPLRIVLGVPITRRFQCLPPAFFGHTSPLPYLCFILQISAYLIISFMAAPLHLSFCTNHALALYLIAVTVIIYCHHIRLHNLAKRITLDLSFCTKPAATFQDSIFSFIPPPLYIINSHFF